MFSKLKNRFFNRLDVRLTLYYTTIVVIICSICGGFFLYRLQHNLMKQLDRVLRDETRELLIEVSEEAGDIIRGCRVFEEDVAHRKYYPIFFRVLDEAGTVLYTSRKAKDVALPSPSGKGKDFFTIARSNAEYDYRIYEDKTLLKGNGILTVQLGTETRAIERIMENPDENIVMALLVVLVLSITCGMLASRKTCRLIKNISTVTNKITSQNLSQRLAEPAARDELYELILTINSMLQRLESAFGEIKQFTADVSHELRNPLFALKGEMEIALSQKRDTYEYREALSECLQRVDMLIKMINDLFLISRFDTQKINLDLDYVNIGALVQDLYDFFLPIAQEKKLQVTCEVCDGAVVQADKTRMSQVVSNLLENAVKFTPKDGSIHIGLERNSGLVELRVRDSGVGISERDLKRIFKRFYQADEARSGPGRGTGLGLQICRRVVEAHGGAIWAEQNEDTGVTFVVTLPVGE